VRELWTYTALCFGSVFAIVDPFAAIPIFLGLTGDRPTNAKTVALRASTTCAVVLLVFAAAGSFILRFFSITMPAFKIAGGIVLFAVGLEMLRAKASRTRSTAEEQSEAHAKEDVALVPLGIPLLAGPGSIATVMVLASKAGDVEHLVVVFAVITAVSLLTFLVLRSAGFVSRALGKTGLNLIGRVMGLILAAIAVQFVLDGAREAFPRLFG
jgi:multiple antibiotic resistance protein